MKKRYTLFINIIVILTAAIAIAVYVKSAAAISNSGIDPQILSKYGTGAGIAMTDQNGTYPVREIDWVIPGMILGALGILFIYDAIVMQQAFKRERRNMQDLYDLNALMESVAYDYSTLYLITPEDDRVDIVVTNGEFFEKSKLNKFQYGKYSDLVYTYANTYVAENGRHEFLEAVNSETVRRQLPEKGIYTVDYLRVLAGKKEYYQAVFAKVQQGGDKAKIVLGFRNINSIVQKENEQKALLREALSEAENANKAKTVFLNSMSHDIRTPMNAIVGFTDLAARHAEEPELVKEYLKKISTSSDHLLQLINDILDMSRIESGRYNIANEEIHLPTLIGELETIFQSDMQAKGLRFVIDASQIQNEYVLGDKLRLNQVFLNLLGNAMKFTKPGGEVSLTVKQLQSDVRKDGKAHYQFVVADTGIGMSEEFQKHVFEAFSREQTATVSGIQGSGLGMSITKSILDMLGGTIVVQSKQDEGSVFTVEISMQLPADENWLDEGTDAAGEPACPDVPDDTSDMLQRSGAEIEPKADAAGQHLQGKRILVVEDNLFNREIAMEMLKEEGFLVEAVEDGDLAVERIAAAEPGEFALILMDIQMRRMDGYTACRNIRALDNPALANIPIIAMTANAFEEDKLAAKEAGMNGYLTKPVNSSALHEVLCENIH